MKLDLKNKSFKTSRKAEICIVWRSATQIPTKLLEAEDCMKSVGMRSFSGSFLVQMRESTDQKNFEYGHLLRKRRRQRLFGSVLFNLWKIPKQNGCYCEI